ncbi:MAG: Gfo/Idh/MocA family oxidoreductase [Chloroflexi bacterium]|nr:Gfo/Idh/MocA family oxidoreductase [Chloroflexota bacterium]
MNPNIIRVGIVGLGGIARHYHLPSYRRYKEVQVVAGADISEQAQRAAQQEYAISRVYTDYQEMLDREELDLISICTSNDMHYPVAMAAIERGIDIYCEKPLALTFSEAKEMYEAARRAGIKTGVNFSHRRTPASRLAKEILDSGALGDIHYVSALYAAGGTDYRHRPGTWRNVRERAGFGGLGDMGSHVLDMMMWWLGCGVEAVTAAMTTIVPDRLDRDSGQPMRVTTEDQGMLLLRYANSALGYLYGGYVFTGRGYDQRAEVYGSDGGLMYDQQRPYELLVHLPETYLRHYHVLRAGGTRDTPYTRILVPERHLGIIPEEPGSRRTVLMDFIDAYLESRRSGKPFQFSPGFYEGLATQEILEASRRGELARCWISLPL